MMILAFQPKSRAGLSPERDVDSSIIRPFDSLLLAMAEGNRMSGNPWSKPDASWRGASRRARKNF